MSEGTSQGAQQHRNRIYICYRHCDPDADVAEALFEVLGNLGFEPFLDTRNECLIAANEAASAQGVAECIETALDQAQALVGIVSANSFESPWMAYEMGSARGRKGLRSTTQRKRIDEKDPKPGLQYPGSSVCIAHVVCGALPPLPAFLKLSTLIPDLEQLAVWLPLLCEACEVSPETPVEDALEASHLDALGAVLPRERGRKLEFEFSL